jgi:serpin B
MLSLASCTPGDSTPTPVVSGGNVDISSIVSGNTAFALDLYRQLKAGDGNIFYSPYSISAALAMTSAGAKENTLQQIAAALHFPAIGGQFNETFQQLDAALKSRSKNIEVPTYSDSGQPSTETIDGFTLNIINALWGQKDYHFLQEYLDLIQQYYGGGLHELDFIHETEKSRLAINDWASEQTNGRIKDLLSPGDVSEFTRLVLTNAIYFNAHWQIQFSESATANAPFYLLDGKEVTVPMMHQGLNSGYTETAGCQALSLPYLGGDMDMVVLLPDDGKFKDFEDNLTPAALTDILGKLKPEQVIVSLPKFTFEGYYTLSGPLTALGMTDAFDGGKADFSGITGTKELSISEVIHKSFVAVDEQGTEAAAVTAVMMLGSAGPVKTIEFNVNRPFIFLIRDIQTGSILFLGRVLNPVG